MIRVFTKILFCFFIFKTTLFASFFRDQIFVGKNNDKYSYFFTATQYTNIEDIEKKINNKTFVFKDKIKILVIVKIPKNINSLQQNKLDYTLNKIKLALNNAKYNSVIAINGVVDKSLSMYEIHLYFR